MILKNMLLKACLQYRNINEKSPDMTGLLTDLKEISDC